MEEEEGEEGGCCQPMAYQGVQGMMSLHIKGISLKQHSARGHNMILQIFANSYNSFLISPYT